MTTETRVVVSDFSFLDEAVYQSIALTNWEYLRNIKEHLLSLSTSRVNMDIVAGIDALIPPDLEDLIDSYSQVYGLDLREFTKPLVEKWKYVKT